MKNFQCSSIRIWLDASVGDLVVTPTELMLAASIAAKLQPMIGNPKVLTQLSLTFVHSHRIVDKSIKIQYEANLELNHASPNEPSDIESLTVVDTWSSDGPAQAHTAQEVATNIAAAIQAGCRRREREHQVAATTWGGFNHEIRLPED